MAQDPRQYGSTAPLRANAGNFPNAVTEFDKARLATYRLYEDLYLTNSADYKVILRGGDDGDTRPIYVPNGEKIVEAKMRFLGQGLKYEFSKKDAAVEEKLSKLFDKENWEQKFENLKRWNEVRGDAILMIIGDDEKVEGSRISIVEIDPSTYFPYEDPKYPNQIMGVYIVDEYPKPEGKKGEVCARVQKYMKTLDNEGSPVPDSPITYSETLYETGKWDDRPNSPLEPGDINQLKVLTPEEALPDQIKTLPTFHFRGHPLMNAIFGRSGLAGLETLITAVNQTMTDEDLIMIFGGLGFYATDAAPPRNSRGEILPWTISPLGVVEHGKEDKMYRVNGVPSLEPSQTHMKYAEESMQQTKGVPDIAVGVVDAAVAESGIALDLKLSAILSSSSEQELELKSVLKQFFYNLVTQWLPAYEGVGVDDAAGDLSVEVTFRDPKPINQEKRFNQLMQMWDSGIISAKKLCEELTKIMGFELTEADFKQAIEDKKSMAIAADPFGAAMAAEQGMGDGEEDLGNAGADAGVTNGQVVG
ncbi:portal protein [Mycobacterium phage Hawkeye]|uniref:Portal protein n=1 Tax=Mycobacterium phage Hawkeye TaxID=1458711 RepID=X2KSJ5_9CAUD|nr:portal protein [Mycobacterium phage Hawkeye]AHN84021.1 portal protein [Mycobacterium phage Hawkeye]